MTTPANTPPTVCPECGKAKALAAKMCRECERATIGTPTVEGRGMDDVQRQVAAMFPGRDGTGDPCVDCGWTLRWRFTMPGYGYCINKRCPSVEASLAESQRERDEARGMFEWAEHQRAVAQAKLAESQRREQRARAHLAQVDEELEVDGEYITVEKAILSRATVLRLTGELAEVRQYAETWLEEFCDGDEWTVAGVIRKAWEEIITQRGTNAEIAAEYGRKLAAAEATLTALRSANTQLDNLLCCARDSLFSADPAECAARAEEIDQELPLIRAEALTPSDTGSQG